MKTDFETLKSLSTYIVNHLTEDKFIIYPIEKRLDLVESLATELGVSFATDDDIRTQAIEEVQEKLGDSGISGDITETEVFNHARKEIIKGFNGEVIAGLYMVESLNQVAHRILEFLLTSDFIEDVFSTDEDIVAFLVTRIRQFSIRRG
ncbi:MAG: DUF507 family protein [Bacteriovoracaceae bacterium]|nr:DUF507 family protein [Bacteriovoracaceae bacterium]